ncbi:araC family transcriptional regulator [Pseudomonas syringae pv. theae ICMP 3923]|uniref:AraC family transcriptional regulator n=5 Tax=Pseudomonas syringae group TaxID=136849 RepID=A0A2G9KWL8_PSESF|nr:AraC family transcriptional regulator [Pseudomonas syringae]OZI83008.1 AraC family transcriptional regulator [Pseudomonas avellanae]ATV19114.1 AraC family transcriptional regulator [Pseudomonas syringae pv. actinidiae]EPM65571.1 araC family transcriptional regulator [Pseudomonas syringae pv. theae ICMP 3923]EPM84791.1 araC family transcriptional regulator [Pseudomonas syringae pv. actinidiae ICMP 18804]EPN24668.1 araC family transcriptional regulator [Pseudomonas syringae pv. actinidiae ICM
MSASTNNVACVDTGRLAGVVSQIVRNDGDHATAIPGLSLHRRNAVTVPLHCIYGLGIGLTLQGSKQVMVGDDVLTYSPGQSMVTSVDLPVVSNVIKASVAQPFLGMMLTFDGTVVMQVAERLRLSQRMKDNGFRPITVQSLDAKVLDALERLVGLLDEPCLISTLSPLIVEEIIIRLLSGAHGPQLLHVVNAGSPSQHIAKAVAWLKQNFRETLRMDDLAAAVYMSPSTFRQHFRAVTGISPLQYQKQLRLQAARQMMLSQNIDASSAGGLVGYESSSQFSREYSRLFGQPPQRDIKRMRL